MTEEQSGSGYPFPQLIPSYSERGNLVLYTAPEESANELEHYLRGESFDQESKTWRKARYDSNKEEWVKTKPVMNDTGVDELMTIIRFFLNKNSTLSNLDRDEINREVLGFAKELAKAIALNTLRWELDESLRGVLHFVICSNVKNTLTRSLGTSGIPDKMLFMNTLQSREVYTVREPTEKRGGLFGWLKKKPKEQSYQR